MTDPPDTNARQPVQPRNLYARNGNWYGRIQRAGKDVRHSLRTRDRDEAERRLVAMVETVNASVGYMKRRRANADKAKVVYFIGGDDGPIKIGVAHDLARRVAELRAANAVPVRLLASCDGGYSVERAYHARFAAHRLHGEWFARHPDILAEIVRLTPSQRGNA